jgi:HEAT repeat protein
VEFLIKALKNKDRDVQQRAADALRETKDPRAVEPLIEVLEDEWDRKKSNNCALEDHR